MPDKEQEDIDDIDLIPLKNLPASGLKVFKYEKWEPGDPTHPNNVLISCLDNLDRVTLVGRTIEDGELLFASSEEDINLLEHDLRKFLQMIERSRLIFDEE